MLRLKGVFRAAPTAWLLGLLFSFALFLPISIPLIRMDASLDQLVRIYLPVLLVLTVTAAIAARRDILSDLGEAFGFRKLFPLDMRRDWPVWGTLVLVAVEASVAMLFAHVDDDDAEYVVMATSAVQTNSLMRFNPYTGKKWKHLLFKRLIAPFPVWEAFQARMTRFHPAVICHFLLPGVFVLASAVAVFLLLDAIFGLEFPDDFQKRQRRCWVGLLLVQLMLIYGNYSTRSMGAMILLRPWQGKALVCGVMLPLAFAIAIRQLTERVDVQSFVLLFVIAMAAALCSAVANLLLPLLLAAASAVKLKNQGIPQALLLFLTMTPALMLDVLTLLFA